MSVVTDITKNLNFDERPRMPDYFRKFSLSRQAWSWINVNYSYALYRTRLINRYFIYSEPVPIHIYHVKDYKNLWKNANKWSIQGRTVYLNDKEKWIPKCGFWKFPSPSHVHMWKFGRIQPWDQSYWKIWGIDGNYRVNKVLTNLKAKFPHRKDFYV